jgi:hypothetical protein
MMMKKAHLFGLATTGLPLLILLVSCNLLQAQGNPPPPPPWAITTPAPSPNPPTDLAIAGSANAINFAGTWPPNDLGWNWKYIEIEAGIFTDAQWGKENRGNSTFVCSESSGRQLERCASFSTKCNGTKLASWNNSKNQDWSSKTDY